MYGAKNETKIQQNDSTNTKNTIILRNISEKRLQFNNKFVPLQRQSKTNNRNLETIYNEYKFKE